MYFKKFDNFHLIHLIVEKLDMFNFHPIFSIVITNFTLTCEIWARFLKNVHQKWKYYREEKQDFERFLIFLNIKMSAKLNKIELSEEFMVMWREEQTLWDVMSPLYQDKNEKDKNFRSSHQMHSVRKGVIRNFGRPATLLKITYMWRRWGTPQNFCSVFIDELEKQLFIKKNCWSGSIKNIGILIFTEIKTNNKKIKKTPGDIIILYLCTNNLHDMIYSSWDTECERLKLAIMGHFLPFLPILRCHHFTRVPKITIIWCMLHGIWNTTVIIFCHFGPFFSLLPHYWPQKWKFGINFKKPWRYYPITHVYHKWRSYDVQFLRYKAWQTEFFVIFGHFLPFNLPNNLKNQNFEKMKKTPEDIIILHFHTKNDDHMMYGSWNMECDRHNFLSFWTTFCPFTSLTAWKIKLKK